MERPIIVIQSDFGADTGVAAMKGVLKAACPEAVLFDLTHDIPAMDTAAASKMLTAQLRAWPEGTVFMSAVDPAGGERHICAIETEDGYFVVSPDNGALADTVRDHGERNRTNLDAFAAEYAAGERGGVCHGRDIAYCTARFAAERAN